MMMMMEETNKYQTLSSKACLQTFSPTYLKKFRFYHATPFALESPAAVPFVLSFSVLDELHAGPRQTRPGQAAGHRIPRVSKGVVARQPYQSTCSNLFFLQKLPRTWIFHGAGTQSLLRAVAGLSQLATKKRRGKVTLINAHCIALHYITCPFPMLPLPCSDGSCHTAVRDYAFPCKPHRLGWFQTEITVPVPVSAPAAPAHA